MIKGPNLAKFKAKATLHKRYEKQLARLQNAKTSTDCIEDAVKDAIKNLGTGSASSLVIYGDPQSGKTEMMISLTAKLLDNGHKIIVHLMNDSVDLLAQNLRRFKQSGLAPAPKNSSELLSSTTNKAANELIVFCKKNSKDLKNLVDQLDGMGPVVVIDDEADYATPNAQVNAPKAALSKASKKSAINGWIAKVLGKKGSYIGVTATPARLDLNNTFKNATENWVKFRSHAKYTGPDVFFPLDKKVFFRLKHPKQAGSPKDARDALVRFLVTSAYLNVVANPSEQNYTMLVHTSGGKIDHEADRSTIENAVLSLTKPNSKTFSRLVESVYATAQELYPEADPEDITNYVVENASRASLIVLNSDRDRQAAGDNPTEPSSPFTIIIGGNIVSRGVTFPNLLAMFFTRDVQHKLQQDTYIQRARMFGARGSYLEHFELTIPTQLYADWHRCFLFHRLALQTIGSALGSPIWLGDSRISVVSSPSIDKATVSIDKGEMSFGMFDYDDALDDIAAGDPEATTTLEKLRKAIGDSALPPFLIQFIKDVMAGDTGTLAIHTASSIAGYKKSVDHDTISRTRGFMGDSQLEKPKYPNASHHIKIFYNDKGRAKLFYKFKGKIKFIQNRSGLKAASAK